MTFRLFSILGTMIRAGFETESSDRTFESLASFCAWRLRLRKAGGTRTRPKPVTRSRFDRKNIKVYQSEVNFPPVVFEWGNRQSQANVICRRSMCFVAGSQATNNNRKRPRDAARDSCHWMSSDLVCLESTRGKQACTSSST